MTEDEEREVIGDWINHTNDVLALMASKDSRMGIVASICPILMKIGTSEEYDKSHRDKADRLLTALSMTILASSVRDQMEIDQQIKGLLND